MMRLDYVPSAPTQMVGSGLAVFATMFTLRINAPVNPSEIVTINETGFKVNVKHMESGKFYIVEFMDARYLIWKNKDEALVMTEVS